METKIKVKSKVVNLQGNVLEGVVKKSGNSAHITLSKKYLGRKVFIVIPKEKNNG